MRPLIAIIIALASALPLLANNLLENSDFVDGINHWRGNGRAPADFAPENPFDKADPFTSKGLILPLRGADWDKIAQDFRAKGGQGVLSITYMVSPGLTFSKKSEDYENIADKLHDDEMYFFNTPPGQVVVFTFDSNNSDGRNYTFRPNLGKGQHTAKMHLYGLASLDDTTLAIGFPPGTGTVVILNISLTQ
jgi:hypothetical protein